MKADHLERAISLRDGIREIDIFLSGYDAIEQPWPGSVTLAFGSYECTIGVNSRGLILQAISAERAAYLDELTKLNVEL
jgi:hypothetical protein